jgi:alkylation response protein AidB-like acyl-CoA dehydrogenase
VPVDAVVGVEGEGFVNTLQVLDAGRIGIAALAVGLAQGAYEARRPMPSRRQFGQADREYSDSRGSWPTCGRKSRRRGCSRIAPPGA